MKKYKAKKWLVSPNENKPEDVIKTIVDALNKE